MSEDLKYLAGNLIRYATQKGASQTQVSIGSGNEFSVEVRNRNIERLTEAGTKSLSFKVIVDSKVATASSSDLSENTLHSLIDKALERAKLSGADSFSGLPEEVEQSIDPEKLKIYDEKVLEITPETKIKFAKEIEAIGLSDKRIAKSSGSGFSTNAGEVLIANSFGFMGSYRRTSCSAGVSFQAGSGDNFFEDGWYSGAVNFEGLMPAEELAKTAVDKVTRLIGARKVKTQNVPVIFEPHMATMILGFLASCISGGAIYMNQSFLVNKINEKIANNNVNIFDDPHIIGATGSRPFDGEGVPCNKMPVIEKGVLKNYLLDTYSGRKLKMKSNGHASGLTNFYLAAGKHTPEEIIKSVDKGLLLTRSIGQGTVPTTGDISKGAFGLWIENGEIAFPVAEITISGSLGKILQNIEMIGNDLKFDRSITAPTIKVSEMTISGI